MSRIFLVRLCSCVFYRTKDRIATGSEGRIRIAGLSRLGDIGLLRRSCAMAFTRGQGSKKMVLAGLAAAMVLSPLPSCESLVIGHPRLAIRSVPRSGSYCWNCKVLPATATGVSMLQGGAGAGGGGGGGGRLALLAATSRTLLANFWDEALIMAEDKVIEFLEVGGIMGFLMEEMVGRSLLSFLNHFSRHHAQTCLRIWARKCRIFASAAGPHERH